MDACVGMKHVIANTNERHGTCIVATDNTAEGIYGKLMLYILSWQRADIPDDTDVASTPDLYPDHESYVHKRGDGE
jgi:hypothetical protein